MDKKKELIKEIQDLRAGNAGLEVEIMYWEKLEEEYKYWEDYYAKRH